ncbi:MAG TPA: transporter substrate-binding domain-containing protein [Stellaceae bacterium]|nr:transporter substrate-binding domain-containing protein [Stellaceae bacterium]
MTDIFSLSRRTLLGAGALALGASLLPRLAAAQSVATIKSRGKVLIGIQGDNPPWGFVNTSGASDGFDAAIGTAFSKYLGVGVEFVPLAVVNRIPALTTGRVDILFATMAMLPERAKAVQFSKPYVANIISLVAAKSTSVKTNADMKNIVIGVPRASSQDAQITTNAPAGTTIRRYDDDAATIQALLSGQVEAVGGNMFYVDRLNQAKPGTFENKLEFTRLYNGACTRLGDKELNAAANSFIDQIRTDGVLKSAYTTWMKQEPPASFPDAIEGVPFVVA